MHALRRPSLREGLPGRSHRQAGGRVCAVQRKDGFHRTDAAGYVFWSELVADLNAINPQVAARLARALDRWKKLAEPYRSAAREAIARVAARTDLSNDVREVVTRALAD